MSTTIFTLPPMNRPFTLSIVGDRTKTKWEGDFVYTRPTLGDRSEIYKTAARLGGDATPFLTEDGRGLNYTLAYLKQTLTSYPKWWSDSEFGMKLIDENILTELIKKTTDAEREWEKELKETAPEKSKK